MYKKSVNDICQALGYSYHGRGDIVPMRIVFDSRDVTPGDCFVAIRGEHVDGARFLGDAVAAGAVCVVAPADSEVPGATPAWIHCADGVAFIQALARWMRSCFDGPVIAVTGSQGKTSTKDFLTHIFAAGHELVVTRENQNNELGLPLTLTRINEATEVVILEMGMSGFGEIDFLAALARPTHALITNIGVVHAEHLGSQAGIARAKTELLKYLPKNGTIAVREEDRVWLTPYLSECAATVVWTDCAPNVAQTDRAVAEKIQLSQDQVSFQYVGTDGVIFDVTLTYAGRHMVENALLAITLCRAMAVPDEVIIRALAFARPLSANRMEPLNIAGYRILNDSYNANPASMQATLEVLAGYGAPVRVACLGNMYELGIYEEEGHRSVGRKVVACGVEQLVTVGELARLIADEARAQGMAPSAIHEVMTNEEAAAAIRAATDEAVILLKGSHSMNMGEIAEYLRKS